MRIKTITSRIIIVLILPFMFISCEKDDINSDYEALGLGKKLTASAENDRLYDWYCDQYGTGTHQYINCGPTSVVMAIWWSDPQATITPMDARNTYRPEGGWWYTSDIVNYLNDNNINNEYFPYSNETTSLTSKLDAGYNVILCLDMFYIRSESNPEHRVDKFYNTSNEGWGHFIVVKGYKVVDKKLFFEVYDPYSINKKYSDETYKGKNRYYRSSDLFTATQKWWAYMIVVHPSDKKSALKGALDPTEVPDARGGIFIQ